MQGLSFNWFFLFILLFLGVLLLLIWPLKVCIRIDNLRENKSIQIVFALYISKGITVMKVSRKLDLHDGNNEVRFQNLQHRLETVKKTKIGRVFRFIFKAPGPALCFLRSSKWRKLDLFLRFGTGDPAWTAIITGCLRTLAGLFSLSLSEYFNFAAQRPRILIYPSFMEQELFFLLSWEFGFNLLQVLSLSATIFVVNLRERWFRKVGTSHSRLNENSHGKFERDGGC